MHPPASRWRRGKRQLDQLNTPSRTVQKWRVRFVHKLVVALWLTSTVATLITGIFLSGQAIGDQKESLRRMVRFGCGIGGAIGGRHKPPSIHRHG